MPGFIVVMAVRTVWAVAMTSETKRHFSDSYLADGGNSTKEEMYENIYGDFSLADKGNGF